MPINKDEQLQVLADLCGVDLSKTSVIPVTNHEEWQQGYDAVFKTEDGSIYKPYRMVSLPALFRNISPIVEVKGQFDTKAALAELERMYGVKFTTNDVTIQFIEGRRIEPGHSYDAHILSKVSSQVYKGCATLRLYNPKA